MASPRPGCHFPMWRRIMPRITARGPQRRERSRRAATESRASGRRSPAPERWQRRRQCSRAPSACSHCLGGNGFYAPVQDLVMRHLPLSCLNEPMYRHVRKHLIGHFLRRQAGGVHGDVGCAVMRQTPGVTSFQGLGRSQQTGGPSLPPCSAPAARAVQRAGKPGSSRVTGPIGTGWIRPPPCRRPSASTIFSSRLICRTACRSRSRKSASP